MPRAPRPIVPGQPLHIIQRGNNRAVSFITARDRLFYRRVLHEAGELTGCAIHSYVLMTNHVHLLVTPRAAESAARMMQAVGRRYVRYFNDCHGRTGTLWEGRYRSTVVDSTAYLFACSRYIENNPTRAGLVDRPEQYRWSSFRRNAYGDRDTLVTPHPAYLALGGTRRDRQAAYRAMFTEAPHGDTIDIIRRATNSGTVLGSAGFRARIDAALDPEVPCGRRGGDRRSAAYRATIEANESWGRADQRL